MGPYKIDDFGPSDLLTSAKILIRRVKVALTGQVFDGNKAITTQSFTELNSKAGTQFEAAFFDEELGTTLSDYLVMITGDKPVSIKALIVQFNSELISFQTFRDPIYTGGTPVPIYNLSDRVQNPSTVQVLAGVTLTDPGTPISPQDYSIGEGSAAAKRVGATSGVDRLERHLRPNTTYLFRITEEATGSSVISGYATWYEGETSNNIPLEE